MSRRSIVGALAGLLVLPAVAGARPATIRDLATQTSIRHSIDAYTVREVLRTGHRVIGHDSVSCIVHGSVDCRGIVTFRRGTVRVRGIVDLDATRHTLSIVGGTGRYKGARGKLKLRDLSSTRTAQTFLFD